MHFGPLPLGAVLGLFERDCTLSHELRHAKRNSCLELGLAKKRARARATQLLTQFLIPPFANSWRKGGPPRPV